MAEPAEVLDGTGDPGDQGAPSLPGWAAALPDDLKGNENLTGFQKVGDLAGAYLEKNGKVSELEGKLANAVIKPGEDATPEELAGYRASLGWPEKAEDYQFTEIKMPEGVEYPKELEADFRAAAHEMGAPTDLADKMHGYMMGKLVKAHEDLARQQQKMAEDAVVELKSDWKDKFDDNKKAAEAAFGAAMTEAFPEEAKADETLKWLKGLGVLDDARFARFCYAIGAKLMPDKLVNGKTDISGGGDKRQTGLDGRPILSYPSMK